MVRFHSLTVDGTSRVLTPERRATPSSNWKTTRKINQIVRAVYRDAHHESSVIWMKGLVRYGMLPPSVIGWGIVYTTGRC